MSSSPRLIVLLVIACFLVSAYFSRIHAAELVLSANYHIPGLTFYNPLTFTTPQPVKKLSFSLDANASFTLDAMPTNDISLETVIMQPNQTITTPPAPQQGSITSSPSPTPSAEPTMIPTATPLPTATPTPAPQVVAPTDLESLFTRFAEEYHVDKELLKRIAKCESSFNPGASYMDYGGMFQFASSSWASTRTQMGHDANPDLRFNAEESIRTAAFKISRDGASAWPSCS